VIFGRPTNLWLGFTASAVGFIAIVAVSAGADPAVVATLAGGATGLLGALVALVAGQPPVLSAGDTFHVTTPAGQETQTLVVRERGNPPVASVDERRQE
jgi:hypothetical protein